MKQPSHYELVRNLLAENIRTLRTRNKWTREELGDLLDLPEERIRGIESGRANMGFKLIVRISEVFAVSLGELLGTSITFPKPKPPRSLYK